MGPLLLLVLLLVGAPAALAAERSRTPSGNIAWLYGSGVLRCDIRQTVRWRGRARRRNGIGFEINRSRQRLS